MLLGARLLLVEAQITAGRSVVYHQDREEMMVLRQIGNVFHVKRPSV